MRWVFALQALAAVSGTSGASIVKRVELMSDSYTECSSDRGLVKSDAEHAGRYLYENLVIRNGFPMRQDECIFRRHNTTIVSLCNGNYRNRTITTSEVRRGVNQLFNDCNQLGSFTGAHVVNNLTFAVYGIFGGINIKVPEGAPPPDTPGSRRRQTYLEFIGTNPRSKRQDPDDEEEVGDCLLGFNGNTRTDCKREEFDFEDDGSCGPILTSNRCQAYCEEERTGLMGPETLAPGSAGQSFAKGIGAQMTEGSDSSVSQGFDVSMEGVFREIFGIGVGYEWSESSATVRTVTVTGEPSDDYKSRWVYFPKLILSCGTVSKRNYESAGSIGGIVTTFCEGDVETEDEQCNLSPFRVDGEAQVFWALRYENDDTTPAPMDDQSPSYRDLCNDPDPDGDGEDECLRDPLEPDMD